MGVGVFTDFLIEGLGLTRMQLSIAYFFGTTMSGLMLPFGGRAYDLFGSRKTAVLVSFCLGLVLVYLGYSDYISDWLQKVTGSLHWWIPFGVILLGFFSLRFTAQGMLTMASQAMIGKWFHERRGLIMSISGMGVSISFSITPWVFSWIINWVGWRNSWLLMGLLLMTGVTLVCYLFFRDNPEECDLEMDGPLKGTGSKRVHPDKVFIRDFTRSEAVRTFSFWAFAAAFAWMALFGTGYTFHVIAISEEIGIQASTMLVLFIPSAISGVLANFLIGYISDYVRIKYVLMAVIAGMICFPLGLLILPKPVGFVVMVLGMGTCNGAYANFSGNVWPRFFGRTHLGAIHGLNGSIAVIASGVGPVLFTIFKDHGPGFSGIFWMGLVVPLGILLLSFVADNPQRKLAEMT